MRIFILSVLLLVSHLSLGQTLRIATFNVSMEGDNYVQQGQLPLGHELFDALATGANLQIQNIAEIIQRVRPDIILLNEFDYTANPDMGVTAFIKNYLHKSQQGAEPIDYPYFYTNSVNTGVDSGLDLDGDGIASGNKDDAFGFGFYPGQYGMVLLSRYPIDTEQVRTFQYFLWKDMPNNLLTTITDEQGHSWYSEQAQQILRLSSKSHWDIPVQVNGKTLHILASHPTPPVFDGPENRNGKRNHDEIRFWVDYLSAAKQASYIYDDKRMTGGFKGQAFVLLGDQNASVEEGDSHKQAIGNLLNHPSVNNKLIPTSEGGKEHSPENLMAATHTAEWRMRADYVLPSIAGLKPIDAGVFWPAKGDPLERLVSSRSTSSDHRLVWLDVTLD
jgi:hypothetical protein